MGAALSGHPIIALDNLTLPLTGDFLCQLTERPRLRPRTLGSSDMTNVIPNGFTVLANGQNLIVAEDMAARRTIMSMLDPDVDDTTTRQFSTPTPTEKIAADRGKFIAAVLTVARAYIFADCPDLTSLPSYEDWCRFVRSPLIWLGEADPVETMAALRESDLVRSQRLRVFSAWRATLGSKEPASTVMPVDGYGPKQIIEKCDEDGAVDLRDALMEFAETPATDRAPATIDPKKLGYWLRDARDTRVGGMKWLLIARKKTSQ